MLATTLKPLKWARFRRFKQPSPGSENKQKIEPHSRIKKQPKVSYSEMIARRAAGRARVSAPAATPIAQSVARQATRACPVQLIDTSKLKLNFLIKLSRKKYDFKLKWPLSPKLV